jgi:hypothetical protein
MWPEFFVPDIVECSFKVHKHCKQCTVWLLVEGYLDQRIDDENAVYAATFWTESVLIIRDYVVFFGPF